VVNLAGVDVILQFKEKIEELERDIEELRSKLREYQNYSTIDMNKNLVKKRSSYDIIIFGG